jgi:putative membrane protein
VADADDTDVTRRTHLAAERTWLAWWRTGGVVPQLVGGNRTPYVILGSGYAVLAAAIFVAAGMRQQHVDSALAQGGYVGVRSSWIVGLTIAGAVLALGTLATIIAEG